MESSSLSSEQSPNHGVAAGEAALSSGGVFPIVQQSAVRWEDKVSQDNKLEAPGEVPGSMGWIRRYWFQGCYICHVM